MRTLIKTALAGILSVAAIGSADAMTCYVIFDRNENVIYRDAYPPVDMSARGVAEREALRNRGEFLMFIETDRCPPVVFVMGDAGTVAVNLEGNMPASALPANARPMRTAPSRSAPSAR